MFRQCLKLRVTNFSNLHQHRNFKIAVLGACGNVGKTLCMLLKQCPLITQVNVFDIQPHTMGVAMDISHIETNVITKGYKGIDILPSALQDMDIVVMAQGSTPKVSGLIDINKESYFESNASITIPLAEAVAQVCPKAHVLVITDPVNSIVPLVSEVMLKNGVYQPNKIYGVITVDVCRANTFYAYETKLNPLEVNVPVIGGHSQTTTIPLFSKAVPSIELDSQKIIELTKKVQMAGSTVEEAFTSNSEGVTPSLAMAYAGVRFVYALCCGLRGRANVVECAYIRNSASKEVDYFATPVFLGPKGVEKNLGIPEISDYEKECLNICVRDLKGDIERGINFYKKRDKINLTEPPQSAPISQGIVEPKTPTPPVPSSPSPPPTVSASSPKHKK